MIFYLRTVFLLTVKTVKIRKPMASCLWRIRFRAGVRRLTCFAQLCIFLPSAAMLAARNSLQMPRSFCDFEDNSPEIRSNHWRVRVSFSPVPYCINTGRRGQEGELDARVT